MVNPLSLFFHPKVTETFEFRNEELEAIGAKIKKKKSRKYLDTALPFVNWIQAVTTLRRLKSQTSETPIMMLRGSGSLL